MDESCSVVFNYCGLLYRLGICRRRSRQFQFCGLPNENGASYQRDCSFIARYGKS